jgi:hypothetical protein
MTEGTDRSDVSRTGRGENGDVEGVHAVGTYETDEGTVLYDTENPLAWMQSRAAVTPEEMV